MSKSQKLKRKYQCKMAFSKVTDSKVTGTDENGEPSEWSCCGAYFLSRKAIHRHLSTGHEEEMGNVKEELEQEGFKTANWSCVRVEKPATIDEPSEPCPDVPLPDINLDSNKEEDGPGTVLLFYKYTDIPDPQGLCAWQRALCECLGLTGKIRIAKEGINATVAGKTWATTEYKKAFLAHPYFADSSTDQFFNESPGDADVFPEGLKVGVYEEICVMGTDPQEVTVRSGGKHLTAREFHEAAQKHAETRDDSVVFVDCRNHYEYKIGHFTAAIDPNVRKFSYWPQYVDKNLEMFRNKDVYMYCTGGVRCERGSAYLVQKGVCRNVFQLKGGIMTYLNEYPDGQYRGKLFVFDDRLSVHSNDDVISKCTYCNCPWDKYSRCSTPGCCQYVLICDGCRSLAYTWCCFKCPQKNFFRRQCDCTMSREQVPIVAAPSPALDTSD